MIIYKINKNILTKKFNYAILSTVKYFREVLNMPIKIVLSDHDSELLANFCLERVCAGCAFATTTFDAGQYSFKCQFEAPPYMWDELKRSV